DARGLAPVAVEGLQDQLDPGCEAHELVGTGPDGRHAEAVVADLLDVLFGHDPRRAGGAGAVERHEVGPRLLELEAEPTGIDDLDLLYALLEQGRLCAPVALERELHVLGGDGIAVVKPRPLAQHELPRAAVPGYAPRLGEAGGVEGAGHRLGGRRVERVGGPARLERG